MPVDTIATLTAGLSPSSRVGMKLAGIKVPPDTLYLAHILDGINLLLWSFSENANSSNKPKPIAAELIEAPGKDNDIESFNSGADFERRRAEILKRITEHKDSKERSTAK